jgi:SAM-dependent methyltransferase
VSSRDFLAEHLASVPAFRALLRSVEARMIAGLDLPRPILDLGCGDGHFAQFTFDAPLDIGIDPSRTAVRLEIADSCAMPFPDGTFATVLSNSVLEHIPDINATLSEVCRVLRPGGLFVFTTPSEHFAEYLFFATIFRRLGMSGLSHRYERYFNRISHHFRTDSATTWKSRLERFGFVVKDWRSYFSSQASHVFDLAHYYSAPTLIYKRLFGRWILAPWRANFVLIDPILRRWYDEKPTAEGAYLFFLCERK